MSRDAFDISWINRGPSCATTKQRNLSETADDFAGSNINALVEKCHRHLQPHHPNRGTQHIFCNVGLRPRHGPTVSTSTSIQLLDELLSNVWRGGAPDVVGEVRHG